MARYAAASHPFSRFCIRFLLLALLVAGCARRNPAGRRTAPESASRAASSAQKIKVEDGSGATLFVLDPSDKGYRVEDGSGGKIGSIKVEDDRVKLSDASGTPAYKVKEKEEGFKLYREPARSGGADIEIARFSGSAGDFRIKDPQGQEIYRGQARGGAVRVEGRGGRRFVIKKKEDGVEVEDASGKRLVRIKNLQSAPAAAFCAAPEYDTLQKAAVTAYESRIGL